MSGTARQNRLILGGILLAVLIWGLVLAIGASLLGPLRGLVVFVSVTIFLSFWGLMLWVRGRRKSKG